VDECQHFVTPSMAEILAGARKYGLGLILAHQDLHQLSTSGEVAAAVMTNAATRIVFKVSDKDASTLAGGFNHFEARDFVNLPNFQAIARIGRADADFNITVVMPEAPDEAEAEECREAAIAFSRETYALPRAEVEAEMFAKLTAELERTTKKPTKRDAAKEAKAVTNAPDEPEVIEKVTGSEKRMTSPPAEEKVRKSEVLAASAVEAEHQTGELANAEPSRVSGQGVGGQDHRATVASLAEVGKRLGFWTRTEYDLPDRQRVDLAMGNDLRRIAIEVAMTENTGHEIENLRKCLKAGFQHVLSVSPRAGIVANMQRAVNAEVEAGRISAGDMERVKCFTVAKAEAWLAKMAEADAEQLSKTETAPTGDAAGVIETKVIAGRRVQVRRPVVSPQERQRIESDNLRAIAEIILKPGPKESE
jgi:hypothetical protein